MNGTNPELDSSKVSTEAGQKGIPQRVAHLLGIVWLSGCSLLLAYALISYILLKIRVAASLPCGDAVRKSERVDSPFVFGIFSPRIYIPFGLSEETEKCVIAHERAHMKRLDHLVKPFGFFLLSLYWFNPLVWVAYVLLCRDIEYACDEKVINDLAPEARKRYAMALLECAVSHKRIVACPVAFGETGVKERVKNTMNYKKPAFWLILCGVLICLTVAVLFMTTSRAEGDGSESSAASSEMSDVSEASDSSDEQSESSDDHSESSYQDSDLNYVDGLISVEYATDELIATLGVYDSYGAERDVNILSTVILPKEDVTEFAIYRICVSDNWANEGSFTITDTLYTQDRLTNTRPLVAELEVGDILPETVISFKTFDGTTYYYTVMDNPIDIDDGLSVYQVVLVADEPEKSETSNEENGEENGEENNENSEGGENEDNGGNVSQPEPHVHAFGAWVTVTEPDCKNTGLKERTCECGDTESEILEKTEHNYVNYVCTVCGASNAPAFIPDYSAGQANTFGNSSGGSQSASQADYIYYADGKTISKTKKTTYQLQTVTKINSGDIFSLNVVGDWLYFYVSEYTASNSYIAKVRTDGSGFEKLLVTGEVWEMIVVKDTIYYTPVNNPYKDYAKDFAPLYSMSVNGGSIKQVHDGCVTSLSADSNYVYYLYSGKNDDAATVYRMKHNGSSKTELWISDSHGYKLETNKINLVGSKLYFVDLRNDKYGEGVEIASINTSGGSYTSYLSVEFVIYDCVYASGSKIYYSGMACAFGDFSEGCGVVEYNTTSKTFKVIYENYDDAWFSAGSGLIFIYESSGSLKIYNTANGASKTLKLN